MTKTAPTATKAVEDGPVLSGNAHHSRFRQAAAAFWATL